MQITFGGHLEKQNGRQNGRKSGFTPAKNTQRKMKLHHRIIAQWNRIEKFYAVTEPLFSIFVILVDLLAIQIFLFKNYLFDKKKLIFSAQRIGN